VLYSFGVDEIDHSPGQFFNSLGSMLQMPGTHMPDNELWPGLCGPHFPCFPCGSSLLSGIFRRIDSARSTRTQEKIKRRFTLLLAEDTFVSFRF
jgi:hypothetical protein